MAWERRGVRKYYYRSVRHGKRVRKEYVGAGEVADLIAQVDADDRIRRARERAYLREERERLEAVDADIEALGNAVDLLVHASLMDAGYHLHKRGEWRRKRTALRFARNQPGFSIGGTMDPLEKKNRRVDAFDLLPGFWEEIGDLARLAEDSMIEVVDRGDLVVQEAIRRKLETIKNELSGPDPTPLEKLLIDLVGVGWLQTTHANTLYAQKFGTGGQAAHKFRQQNMNHALRRFHSTIKTLAQVRRLLGPQLQVNIGKKQVNISN